MATIHSDTTRSAAIFTGQYATSITLELSQCRIGYELKMNFVKTSTHLSMYMYSPRLAYNYNFIDSLTSNTPSVNLSITWLYSPPGRILSAESTTIKIAEGGTRVGVAEAADQACWSETSSTSNKRKTQIVRLFYVKGPPTKCALGQSYFHYILLLLWLITAKKIFNELLAFLIVI